MLRSDWLDGLEGNLKCQKRRTEVESDRICVMNKRRKAAESDEKRQKGTLISRFSSRYAVFLRFSSLSAIKLHFPEECFVIHTFTTCFVDCLPAGDLSLTTLTSLSSPLLSLC